MTCVQTGRGPKTFDAPCRVIIISNNILKTLASSWFTASLEMVKDSRRITFEVEPCQVQWANRFVLLSCFDQHLCHNSETQTWMCVYIHVYVCVYMYMYVYMLLRVEK